MYHFSYIKDEHRHSYTEFSDNYDIEHYNNKFETAKNFNIENVKPPPPSPPRQIELKITEKSTKNYCYENMEKNIALR